MTSTTSEVASDLPAIPAERSASCPLRPPAEFTQWRDEPGLRRAIYQGRPTWVVSRYEDIRAALVDPRLSAETIPASMLPKDSNNNTPVMFARVDDPEHHRIRRMLTRDFTFRRVDGMRPQIQEIVDRYLDEMLDSGPRSQVRRLTLNPGATLSLHMHHYHAEHWVVVKGTAKITRGDEEFLLTETQSTSVPIGIWHRLANPGSNPLELIEVQSGSYLGEDDIVHTEDHR